MKLMASFLLATVLTPIFAAEGQSHPKKVEYRDAETWPAVTPGQVQLREFSPFRAVYTRNYRQGAGPKKGESRTDRVIITTEEVGWDGRPAALINMFDTGEAKYDDTNGRTFSMYVDLATLALLFEMGPVPGKGKDYYLLRVLDKELVGTFVTTEKGDSKNQRFATTEPGFGAPGPWIVASMNLKEGQKLRFQPAYSVGLGPLSAKSPFRVIGRETVEAADGKRYQTWVTESISNLTSPWVQRTYVIDRPPYLIKRESVNLDSGEKTVYMLLRSYHAFSN